MATPADAAAHRETLTNLPFPGGYPAAEAAATLWDELLFQRAVQVYLWALPAMNLDAMRRVQESEFGTGGNVLAVWKDRIDANTVVLTANPDVIYALAWLDLDRDGPTVVEAPAGLQGLLDDAWHRPLTDVGLAGPDQGKGGKYLVLPPGFEDQVPDGYFVLQSPTYGGFVFWRAFLENGKTEPGVRLMEQTRIYPLVATDQPPPMQFPNASGVPLDMLFPRDGTYFQHLARFFDREPAAPEDFALRGMAATLGIIKGQPFQPDAAMTRLLDQAAQTGFKMATTVAYTDNPSIHQYPDRMWRRGFHGDSPVFKTDTYLDFDAMIAFFHSAYSTSQRWSSKCPARGPSTWAASPTPTATTSPAIGPTSCTSQPTCRPQLLVDRPV